MRKRAKEGLRIDLVVIECSKDLQCKHTMEIWRSPTDCVKKMHVGNVVNINSSFNHDDKGLSIHLDSKDT
jgi:hypothetical protein